MKIGFDAKRITHNATGLGNYSRFVVNGLSSAYPDHAYYLYSPSEGQRRLRDQIQACPQVRFRYPASGRWQPKAWWRSRGIVGDLLRDGIDIFHGLSNELPFGLAATPVRSVVTLHDLIFLRYPAFYPWIDRRIYRYKFERACREADRVIAVSETTRRDLVRFFGIDERKISVVYQGCDEAFGRQVSEAEKEAVRRKYDLPTDYLLNVGSIEDRKNLLLILRALPRLRNGISLVAAGRPTPYLAQVTRFIRENGLSGRVKLLHGVSFADLPALYQSASVFIYPSFFEGFGIPVLEALRSKVPVIAATGSCLEEAGGPGSLYVDPHDAEGLAEKIDRIVSDAALRREMIETGLAYSENFAPQVLSERLMNVYEAVRRS